MELIPTPSTHRDLAMLFLNRGGLQAHVLCEALYASTAGIFFAWKLGSLYGVRYAVAPYVYLWSTFAITQKLAPVKWGKIMGRIRSDFASYGNFDF